MPASPRGAASPTQPRLFHDRPSTKGPTPSQFPRRWGAPSPPSVTSRPHQPRGPFRGERDVPVRALAKAVGEGSPGGGGEGLSTRFKRSIVGGGIESASAFHDMSHPTPHKCLDSPHLRHVCLSAVLDHHVRQTECFISLRLYLMNWAFVGKT